MGALALQPHSQLLGAGESGPRLRTGVQTSDPGVSQSPGAVPLRRRPGRPPFPGPKGPAGRGGGRGQHEPGGPASRRRAGGGGRSAAAGHPELPPERRRGPGEPGGWRGGDARPNAGRSGERAAAGARGGPGPDPEGLLASGKGWGWNPNRHVQETSANHLRCLRGWRRSWGDGSKKRKMVTVP